MSLYCCLLIATYDVLVSLMDEAGVSPQVMQDNQFTMQMSPNISRSKGNQEIKLGQLIEDNITNIFLEKSCIKCVGETFPKLFSKKS